MRPDVVGDFGDIGVVQCCIDLVEHEERCGLIAVREEGPASENATTETEDDYGPVNGKEQSESCHCLLASG